MGAPQEGGASHDEELRVINKVMKSKHAAKPEEPKELLEPAEVRPTAIPEGIVRPGFEKHLKVIHGR